MHIETIIPSLIFIIIGIYLLYKTKKAPSLLIKITLSLCLISATIFLLFDLVGDYSTLGTWPEATLGSIFFLAHYLSLVILALSVIAVFKADKKSLALITLFYVIVYLLWSLGPLFLPMVP